MQQQPIVLSLVLCLLVALVIINPSCHANSAMSSSATSPPPPPANKIKLTYFNIEGAAEPMYVQGVWYKK